MSGELLQRECNTTGDAALALLIAEHLRRTSPRRAANWVCVSPSTDVL